MKIGLEIHQRIQGKKLFCNCPTELAEGEPDITVQRRLHPVFSELGEVDAASQAEFAKDRLFEYQAFHASNCLVETDEEPPGLLNENALKAVLDVAFHLNASPVHEVHIMRKTVIDGSNTSGFQRTSIVALDGHVHSSKGMVRIPLIAIEEESAGIVAASKGDATYRLDRLGIPLVEITTDPDIKDGEHLKEVAEKIGMILRATGKVARGLGTIRQDVNVSTEGGARVEIKGAQDLKMLPEFVDNEAKRQMELVKILALLRKRNAFPVRKRIVDVSAIFGKTDAKLIKTGLESGASVFAMRLPEHKGILGKTIQIGKRYGTELSSYAKAAGVKGIIHSDENLSKYGITEKEIGELEDMLNMREQDCLVLIVAPKQQAEKALENVHFRANMDFVPGETRRANPDGSSTYMRPLPGRARLYPETDVPPIPLSKKFLDSIEKTEPMEKKKEKLEKVLNKEMAGKILKSRHLHLFERLVASGTDPMLVATTIENTLVSLRREGVEFGHLEETLTGLFDEFRKGTFVKAAIPEVLKGMTKGASAESVLKVYRLQKISGKGLEKIVAENDYDMKKIMSKARLQVDPQEVSTLLKKKKGAP
jgi:glutamyl-tRNA(Gln) amidotransferase subunit E